MTRPSPPRLPELGGMTEAGFNRVVSTIQLRDFGVPVSRASERRYNEWRALLPKTRNRKQRKADAQRAFENPVLGVPFELTAEQVSEFERDERSYREYERRKLKGGG